MESIVLVVEDDAEIRQGIGIYLKNQGYTVLEAADGAQGLAIIRSQTVHLAIVDIMMPVMDGITMVMQLRQDYDFPVIFLSAKSEDIDKITGLNIGADDYVTKPFNPVELLARVRSRLRRYMKLGGSPASESAGVRQVGPFELDDKTKTLTQDGEPVALTPTEYKILAQLMAAPGRIFTKVQLYEGIAGEYFESNDNTMMVHISKLREKIGDDPKNPRYIITIRGLGYKIEP